MSSKYYKLWVQGSPVIDDNVSLPLGDDWVVKFSTDNAVGITYERFDPATSTFSLWYASTLDGGVTWVQSLVKVGDYGFPSIDKASDNLLVIAAVDSANNNIVGFESTNGGLTWGSPFTIRAGKNTATTIRVIDANTWIAATVYFESSGLRLFFTRTTNAGSTWSTPLLVDGDYLNASAVGVAVVSPTHYLLAVLADEGGANKWVVLAESTNSGTSFTLTHPATVTAISVSQKPSLRIFDATHWFIGYQDQSGSPTSTTGQVLATANSGSSWSNNVLGGGGSDFVLGNVSVWPLSTTSQPGVYHLLHASAQSIDWVQGPSYSSPVVVSHKKGDGVSLVLLSSTPTYLVLFVADGAVQWV